MAPFLWGGPVTPGVPDNPVSVIFGIVDFISSLLGLGREDISAVVQAVNSTWANLAVGSSFLYDSLGFLSKAVDAILGTVVKALGHIITDILHGRLKDLVQSILNILKKLHDAVAPLILWLRQLQKIQRQYQLQALKTIVNLIQRARQFLVVLKLLHVKWAQRLDGWLLQVEGKLISHVYALFQKQNEVIGWLNWALDPTAMIRSTPYFGTFARGMKAVWGAAQAIGITKLFPQLAHGTGPRGPVVTHAQFYANSFTGGPAGDGYFGEAQRSVTALQERMRGELGGLTL